MRRMISKQISLLLCIGSALSTGVGYEMNPELLLVSAQESTENDVVLVSEAEGGACFYYKDSTNGLIIDGSGSFTIEEFNNCLAQNKVNYIVVGKHVNIPIDEEIAPMNNFLLGYSYDTGSLYGYAESDIEDKLNSMLDYIVEIKNKNNSDSSVDRDSLPYKINIVPDEIAPYDVIPEEKLPVEDDKENVLVLCGKTDSGVKFYYKKADHGVFIEGKGAFSEEEFNSAVKDDVEYIVIGKDVVIPESITDTGVYLNTFLMAHTIYDGIYNEQLVSTYTYPGSDAENKFKKMINYFKHTDIDSEPADVSSASFKLNIIDEGVNPYDIKKTCDTTLFLRGDITGNGIVDVTDLTELSLYLIGDSDFDCAQKIYSDIDDDDKIGMTDLARLRQYISKLVENWEDYKIYK